REGVKFHNGDPVTAEDVVWSISRAAGMDSGTPIVNGLDSIASVEAADDSTVVITLVEPNIEFLAYLTVAILPAGYEQQDTAPIGTGPFKFVSRSAQENIILERFEDYWGEPALLDKVTFKIIEDGSALVMALQSGAVDLCAHLTSSQCAELGNMDILQGTMNLVQALYLNNADAPFNDVKVRQALCYAIDKQQIIDMTSDGAGVPLGSSMYPAFGKYFMDELTDYYPYDPDKAKELLAEAGYDESHPLSFTITVPSNYTPHVDAAQIMVDQLSKVGVNAKMEQVEWATWYSDVYQGRKFQSTVCGMDASTMTARAMLERFNSASPKDFINFVNASYDDAFNRAISAKDEDSQLQAYQECMTILTEQAANVYVQDLADLVAINPALTGYRFYPLYVMDLSGVGFRE
ncbi:MAG: ABC transporter substrate-binding protein, partial [Firmicutes bacterium]|nr:ABC transporter substrate-binding protein [Bacillota bacterium]